MPRTEQNDQIIGIVEDGSMVTNDGVEYAISTNEDGFVAYRLVQMPSDSKIGTTTTTSTSSSQQCQYILIDSIVPTTTTTVLNSGSTSTNNNVSRSRSNIAIAPKARPGAPMTSTVSSSTKSSLSAITPTSNVFKKRDDKRRATHNEVERRRRDKINHWIMKLGSIIPADGRTIAIGDSGRLSIAGIEGQSKGGILSKACEYIQMLQEPNRSKESQTQQCLSDTDSKASYDKKKSEEELCQLRADNELLRALLLKHGINYTKERVRIASERL